jgi:hypothetical protein
MRAFSIVSQILPAIAVLTGVAFAATSAAKSETAARVTGPHVHENLSVFFVHGASAEGPVPLTLQEAMARKSVNVIETGSVNELQIENTGTEDIFVQSGDIVKGGKQDRVLMVSLLLPPKSGKVGIASFCVEQGRWTARGKENVAMFASSADALPSREAKLAMKAPMAKPSPDTQAATGTASQTANRANRIYAGDETSTRQRGVWDEVAKIQDKLTGSVGARVAAPQSATSLQLSLENDALKSKRSAFIAALEGKAAQAPDVIGYVFAINGKVNSADIYPSNALFNKMWGKLLNASVTEAIGETKRPASAASSEPATAPATADVEAFLKSAESGKADAKPITTLMVQETRDAEKSLYVEAKRADGRWVHRNYLAK